MTQEEPKPTTPAQPPSHAVPGAGVEPALSPEGGDGQGAADGGAAAAEPAHSPEGADGSGWAGGTAAGGVEPALSPEGGDGSGWVSPATAVRLDQSAVEPGLSSDKPNKTSETPLTELPAYAPAPNAPAPNPPAPNAPAPSVQPQPSATQPSAPSSDAPPLSEAQEAAAQVRAAQTQTPQLPQEWHSASAGYGQPVAAVKSLPWALLLTLCLVTSLVAGVFGGAATSYWQSQRESSGINNSVSIPVPKTGSTVRASDSIAGISQKVLPSVVLIEVKSSTGAGTGSGFILRSDGYIVTNNHVIDEAASSGKIKVTFNDGSTADAKIVGRDEAYDLAALKVEKKNLTPLSLGDSNSVVVGDSVIAFGAPLGLGGTVTTGIVSALNRPVSAGGSADSPSYINAVQTDAAINPGNSGGPLVNMQGQVIAVNSAIARVPGAASMSGPAGNIGLGFAIPSVQVQRTVEQLIQFGKATYPIIGAILDREYEGTGVKISDKPVQGKPPITAGGPADKAGLKPGDVITTFNGSAVNDGSALVVAIRAKKPGEVVELSVRTGDRERVVRVTLQAAGD